ncbi:DNA glycosylase AlkZ-like family protein [Geomicrobium sp. JSM 1781026]|uniref:DNA glycosylase AlkZ-like family protein n=1 Tax=Geomicrobium sp. JSM 1781026 TaxID=3344580 RepID=UPI0035C15D25
MDQLEAVQLDPVSVVEKNHHLVLMNRIKEYSVTNYTDALGEKRAFEYFANAACLLPMKDYPLLKGKRVRLQEQWRGERGNYRESIADILDRLQQEGPLPATAFLAERKVVGGWDHPTRASTKETTHALRILFECGDIQVSGREKSIRHYARTDQWIPEAIQKEADMISIEEADALLMDKYLRAYRLFDARDPRLGWQKLNAQARKETLAERKRKRELFEVQIEGVDRPYYVLEADAEQLVACEHADVHEHVRFLSPLDNLLWRRERVEELFDFFYRWEIYVPKTKRMYGPYTMPVLVGDTLIGKVDPYFDRANGRLYMTTYEGVGENDMVVSALEKFAQSLGARELTITTAER